mgnify:CR=1 FL=1
MKCDICGTEKTGPTCVQCEQNALDATGVLSLEESGVESPATLADLAPGAAALVVVRGPATGEIWPLTKNLVDVGRSADSALFLDDITVSRKHAIFRKTDEGWTLEDSGSLNGSYINRGLISTPTLLKSGDEIQLGKFRFTFNEGAK